MNKLQNLTNRKKVQRRQIRREEEDIMYQYLSAEYCPFQFSFHENVLPVTNGLYYAAGFILILQGGKGREEQKDSYLQYLIKDRRVPDQKGRGMRLWRYQGANALGVCPQNPLFVARAMETLRKVIRIGENLENQEKHVYLQCQKNKQNNKNKKNYVS